VGCWGAAYCVVLVWHYLLRVSRADLKETGHEQSGIDRVHTDRSHRDWLLYALTVASGAVDVISFRALGKVFTAFMTGNFVFLGMSIARHAEVPSLSAVLVPMAGFALGVYLATLIVIPETVTNDHKADVVWPPRVTYALGVSPAQGVRGRGSCGSRGSFPEMRFGTSYGVPSASTWLSAMSFGWMGAKGGDFEEKDTALWQLKQF
jgi:Protein of unknown function (DUF1275)